ncbi:hypothetical protein [uncultured Pseudodesulfovibrio sp.]|uniref:hypothetical protein n=1 Tax=uncultured Pseudodesulfovibrio sp. TaxID=2035858 RepID=UPI0029C89C0D|nr:hypothetical protein [uncultured Pseudodesulfovibrio sp.]
MKVFFANGWFLEQKATLHIAKPYPLNVPVGTPEFATASCPDLPFEWRLESGNI